MRSNESRSRCIPAPRFLISCGISRKNGAGVNLLRIYCTSVLSLSFKGFAFRLFPDRLFIIPSGAPIFVKNKRCCDGEQCGQGNQNEERPTNEEAHHRIALIQIDDDKRGKIQCNGKIGENSSYKNNSAASCSSAW